MGKNHNNYSTDFVTADVTTEEVTAPNVITIGVVSSKTSLCLREMPEPTGKIIATLNPGTELEIDEVESTDDFYKVCTSAGLEGYCMKKFINLD